MKNSLSRRSFIASAAVSMIPPALAAAQPNSGGLLSLLAGEQQPTQAAWRDAGITWSIIRGDDIVKVQRRAGHKLIATTQRYIVEAENRGATFGTPFPPLPDRLVSASKLSSKDDGSILQVTVTIIEIMYRRRDSNPHARKDGGF